MLHELISLINVVFGPLLFCFFYVDLELQSTGFLKTSAAFPLKVPALKSRPSIKGLSLVPILPLHWPAKVPLLKARVM